MLETASDGVSSSAEAVTAIWDGLLKHTLPLSSPTGISDAGTGTDTSTLPHPLLPAVYDDGDRRFGPARDAADPGVARRWRGGDRAPRARRRSHWDRCRPALRPRR